MLTQAGTATPLDASNDAGSRLPSVNGGAWQIPAVGKGYKQHDRFWYDDRMVYLATANHILYKLPLFLFPESTYLASLTRNYTPDPRKDDPLPRLSQISVEGAVYHVLDDVTSTELDALMSILTPSYIESRPEVSSYEGLAAVLKLSTRWGLSAVRRFALRRLDETIQPVQRLALARSCNIDKWVSRALISMCERPEPLSLDDILQMTPEDIALVTQVREQARTPASPVAPKSADITRFIEEVSLSVGLRSKKLGLRSSAARSEVPSSASDDAGPSELAHDNVPIPGFGSALKGSASSDGQPTFVFGQPRPTSPGERPFTPELPHLPTPVSGSDSGNEEKAVFERVKTEKGKSRASKNTPFKLRKLASDDVDSGASASTSATRP
ncbi:unnamed protein product [Peniophora sp. CBMAI 1063]|nr:unnamed protein product [Peniophora sp. CBMAI 1063]